MEVHVPVLPKKLILPKQHQVRSPPFYFQLPTTMAAVGPRGRGKTYNLTLWNQWMFENEYFTRFFVISPTYDSNPPLHLIPTRPEDIYTSIEESLEAVREIEHKVIEDAKIYEKFTKDYPKLYRKYMSKKPMVKEEIKLLAELSNQLTEYYMDLIELYDVMLVKSKWIEDILSYMKIHEPDPKKEEDEFDPHRYLPPPVMKRPSPLLFIDDMSHSPIYAPSRGNPLVNMTLRHRHLGGQGYGVTIQFAVQTFKTGVPKALRANTMQFLLFKTNDRTVLDDIYEELGAFCTKEQFLDLYDRAVQGAHDFLLVDVNTKDENRVFRRNFDTILLCDHDKNVHKKRKITQTETS